MRYKKLSDIELGIWIVNAEKRFDSVLASCKDKQMTTYRYQRLRNEANHVKALYREAWQRNRNLES